MLRYGRVCSTHVVSPLPARQESCTTHPATLASSPTAGTPPRTHLNQGYGLQRGTISTATEVGLADGPLSATGLRTEVLRELLARCAMLERCPPSAAASLPQLRKAGGQHLIVHASDAASRAAGTVAAVPAPPRCPAAWTCACSRLPPHAAGDIGWPPAVCCCPALANPTFTPCKPCSILVLFCHHTWRTCLGICARALPLSFYHS